MRRRCYFIYLLNCVYEIMKEEMSLCVNYEMVRIVNEDQKIHSHSAS
jgi:hypothetical protein